MSRSPSYSGPRASRSDPDSDSMLRGGQILETLGLFAIVFVLQQFAALIGAVALTTSLFVLHVPIETNPWTIVTSVYAHGTLEHLLSNSVALVVFGWPVARATTRFRFHAFFVVTGAIAGLSQVLVPQYLAYLPFVEVGAIPGVLGASGAVFALLGYLITGNRISESIASRVAIPHWMTLLFFVVLAAVVTIATAAPRVALIAHFTGFLLGLVAGRARLLDPSPRGPVRDAPPDRL